MSKEKLVRTHRFNFSPQENSGEALTFITNFFDNGDGEIFTNQEIRLHSYCNSASINLSGIYISPEDLRKLADQMEEQRKYVQNCLKGAPIDAPIDRSINW